MRTKNLTIVVSLAFLVVVSMVAIGAPQSETDREPGEAFIKPDKYAVINAEELIEMADGLIKSYGMQVVSEQKPYIVSQGRWLRMQGILYSADDPELPLFILAVKGKGEMIAAGGHYADVNFDSSVDGMTIALNATTGSQITLNGRYIDETEVPSESFGSIQEYLALSPEKTAELIPVPDAAPRQDLIPVPTYVGN